MVYSGTRSLKSAKKCLNDSNARGVFTLSYAIAAATDVAASPTADPVALPANFAGKKELNSIN